PMVTGPSWLDVLNLARARAQPSPFRSAKLPVAPAEVGLALRISCVMMLSPLSKVDPSGQGFAVSCQTVASMGVGIRNWTPLTSVLPLPTERTILPFVSEPWPVGVQGLQVGLGQSSPPAPYVQSAPGSLVSPRFTTSLSPVWGCEVLTTPAPHATWSTRPQSPPRIGMLKVGTVKPGVSQQVFFAQPFVGAPGGVPHPGMPAQAA